VLPEAFAATDRFRLAICNETFQNWTFAKMCQGARRLGYTGLEIAPFTLGDDPAALSAEKRRELQRTMASEGIAYVGLHAILTAPKGLHVTTPDAEVRQRSWEYILKLVDLAADLGEGAIVVFGSASSVRQPAVLPCPKRQPAFRKVLRV
jgi:D-psicose/D-tagatose/L-ribulose 3-epimerase